MLEPPLTLTTAAARAQVMASALTVGRRFDQWSLVLVTVALLSLFLASMPLPAKICLLASILAGGMQQMIALRVAFDEIVFQQWANKWAIAASHGLESSAHAEDLAAFDQALATCELRAPSPSDGIVRDLDSRLRGARGLLERQARTFALQVGATAGAAVMVSLMPVG